MTQQIRYGDFQRRCDVEQEQISYNRLTPVVKTDNSGKIIPHIHPPIVLRPLDVYRLLKNYTSPRFMDQFRSVVPLAIYLVLFQIFILRELITDSWVITGGLLLVIVGLMLFMEGLRLGLMPFGEIIGNTLPRKSTLPVVLVIAFLLGVGVTFAEPAIGALKAVGSIIQVEKAPVLYALLNDWSMALVLVVGGGVGLAAILGTLRFLYAWSLKPLIYYSVIPGLMLSAAALMHPEVSKVLGLAWDCGGVTTGPVTVPLVLSLGIGIAASAGKGDNPMSGFGIVTLASVFPVIGVISLGFVVAFTTTPAEIIAAAKLAASAASAAPAWYEESPGLDAVLGVRAILPLVLFLFLVLRVVLKEPIRNGGMLTYGIILAIAGMITFNIGLTYGLAKLGSQSGSLVPAAFMKINEVAQSPLYAYGIGLTLAVLFAWFLGFGATLAEPALNALGDTVQNLTNGVFKKSLLMYAVSFGVAFGIAIGLLKLILDLPIFWMLLPGYVLALVLTYFSTEEFVNIAWDSAGVTTGPITVPLVLAMGLGFGNVTGVIEGFGILTMASVCPIISVMMTGLWVRYRASQQSNESLSSSLETAAL
ncbi:MAG: DUF1538 domain-containing protein [Magnetococcales bacterium]|nr:DUF1538 domain-containing protein [Magnetococcales bacterium]MBF0115953.1 DUF1538 domain-containing protein [Magnetococcales bacterium]